MSDEEPKPRKPRAKKATLPADGTVAEANSAATPKPRARKASQSGAPVAGGKAPAAAAVVADGAPRDLSMRLVVYVSLAIILLDQALKYVVVHVMRLDRVREIDLLDPWLNLRMAWNQGVNFGLFSSDVNLMRWVLIAVAAAVCIWVWVWLRRTEHSKFAQVAAGFLIGGALGNVIDRIAYGAVADFLNMSLPNWQNPYSFNVADIAIFIGAFGLFLQPPAKKEAVAELRTEPVRRKKPSDKTRDEANK